MRIAIFVSALSLVVCTIGLADGDQSKPKTHTVTIENMKFQPEVLTVASGDSVIWVNKDLVPHTATSSKPGIFDSKMIASDTSWKLIVRKKGDFAYVCSYHPTMKATLRVE